MPKHILEHSGNGRWYISGGEPTENGHWYCIICGAVEPPEYEECPGECNASYEWFEDREVGA